MPARALVVIVDDGSSSSAEITKEDLAVYRLHAGAGEASSSIAHRLVPAAVDADQIATLLEATRTSEAPPNGTTLPRLSPREREVLRWISGGMTHGQTATRMRITKATVDTYVERIRRKLGAGNKADLTRAAVTLDLWQGAEDLVSREGNLAEQAADESE
jgi:DNA-binding CsgD family transcriptional regulator